MKTVEISPLCAQQLGVVHKTGLFAYGKDGVIESEGRLSGMNLRYNDAMVNFYADVPENADQCRLIFGDHFFVDSNNDFFLSAIA